MSLRDELDAALAKQAAAERRVAELEAELQERAAAERAEVSARASQVLLGVGGSRHFLSTEEIAAFVAADRSSPSVIRIPPTRTRRHCLSFGPLDGKRGEWLVPTPIITQVLFRVQEIFATDTATKPGHGTIIQNAFISNNSQLLMPVPTRIFSEWMDQDERAVAEDATQMLGTSEETEAVREMAYRLRVFKAASDLKWPTCQPGLPISFEVEFLEDCTWHADLWGDAIL